MPINVSIIICTINRADSLAETLESIAKLSVPTGWKAELLVVDNGSTDYTRSVLERFHPKNLSFRHVFEPVKGLSQARNTGLSNTAGEIILFTDDDVRPPENWIGAMGLPIANGECDAVAGGVSFPPRIASVFTHPTLASLKPWFASTDDLHPECPVRMVGANMAFGRHVLTKVPTFDTELGPGQLGFGDETLFSVRLLREGFRIKSLLNLSVEHHFDLSRITYGGLVCLARRMGESDAYIAWHFGHKKHLLNSVRLLTLKLGLKSTKSLSKITLRSRKEYPSPRELACIHEIGYRERYRHERQRKQKY